MSVQQILRIDNFGALISFILLAFILPHYIAFIGLPKVILYGLAIYAFLLYLLGLYFLRSADLERLSSLLAIMIGNSIYCVLSLSVIYVYTATIKPLGLVYFIVEKIIVLAMVYLEWKVYKKTFHS